MKETKAYCFDIGQYESLLLAVSSSFVFQDSTLSLFSSSFIVYSFSFFSAGFSSSSPSQNIGLNQGSAFKPLLYLYQQPSDFYLGLLLKEYLYKNSIYMFPNSYIYL